MSFDYGATPTESGSGGSFKQPELGGHAARLQSIIHLGMFEETYSGKKKAPAPICVAVFELKEDSDFEDTEDGELDTSKPLYCHKTFSLRTGDKAFATKITKALDPDGEATGFDDLIGAPCEITMVGSKKLNEDKTPKYTNFSGITALNKKLIPLTADLLEVGAGHLRFAEITKEAILQLRPLTEVADTLMKGMNYEGSRAQELIAEIRAEKPEFAVRTSEGGTNESPQREDVPPPSDMDNREEF
jgi:hypothetical protein